MKITGTRSYIKVEIDGKELKIPGELATNSVFYADINSIKSWEPPYQNILISEVEKAEIIDRIINETQSSSIQVIFE